MLVIEIQPTDGMFLEFNVKKPGDGPGLERVKLEYCQSCNRVFHLNTPEAYERMLWAAINSDQSWFSQWDQIETSWRYIQSVKDAYRSAGLPVYPYVQQSEGPIEASQLTQGLVKGWRVMKDPQD
jgi:glucose-6-phosphate 1-dehydrogenase